MKISAILNSSTLALSGLTSAATINANTTTQTPTGVASNDPFLPTVRFQSLEHSRFMFWGKNWSPTRKQLSHSLAEECGCTYSFKFADRLSNEHHRKKLELNGEHWDWYAKGEVTHHKDECVVRGVYRAAAIISQDTARKLLWMDLNGELTNNYMPEKRDVEDAEVEDAEVEGADAGDAGHESDSDDESDDDFDGEDGTLQKRHCRGG